MITDYCLENVASAIAAQTYIMPSYLAVGTSTIITTINTTDESIDGEIGVRKDLVGSSSGNNVTFTATRTVGDVITTSTGDTLTVAGITGLSTGDNLFEAITIGGVTQTTNINVEYEVNIIVDRP